MKFKKIILTITILFATQVTIFSQGNSSYTRIGLGDLNYSFSARKFAMGGLGVAVSDKNSLSEINPAAWNALNQTRVDFGFGYNGLFLSNNQNSAYSGNAEFNGFTLAFPISKDNGIGFALGMLPFTNVRYKVQQSYTLQQSTPQNYNITYEGNGGLSKLFFGSSYTLPFGVSIGATLDYYLGTINYTSTADFNNSSNISSSYLRTYRPNGLGSTFGLISPDLSSIFNSKSLTDLRLGFSANYVSNLNTDTILTSKSNVGIDTLGSGTVEINVPMRINAGISFTMNDSYLVTLDFASQAWHDYSFNNIKSSELRNSVKVSAGFEYQHKRVLGETFWEQFSLRAGLSYEQTPYIVNNKGIDEMSVSAGFSIPLGLENGLDVGLQYAIRGTKEANLMQEHRLRLDVGISLGEIWFLRRDN